MFERLRKPLLRWLRVPPEPQPPFGDPASVRVFRASRKFYYLRLIRWTVAQSAALGGLLFWMVVIGFSEREADRMRAQNAQGGMLANLPAGRNQVTLRPLGAVPHALFTWLWVLKGAALAAFTVQLAFTYAAVRLDYELRWYIVTDRSLRIRRGLWIVEEATMSYVNLQQVACSQGPLERLLGIANVRVVSAGGGGANSCHGGEQTAGTHSAVFHGVENASQIRDLILERLRLSRGSGLGDPDDSPDHAFVAATGPSERGEREALAAARDLLEETRKLRLTLTGPVG